MISYGLAAGFAGFAFLLSFLVGIVSGVGFGSTLVRAFLSGIVFALLGTGVNLLFRALFPDFLVSTAVGKEAHETASDESSESARTGAAVDITLDDDAAASDDETDHFGSDTAAGGFVEEIKDDAPQESSGFSASDDDRDTDMIDSAESMDELPSLDAFSDSFESDWGGGGDEESPGPAERSSDPDIDVLGDTQSPGNVARAVQTMMKRDQEG